MQKEHRYRYDHRDQTERKGHALAGRRTGMLVDGKRQGLGYTGDAAGHNDRGTELSQTD